MDSTITGGSHGAHDHPAADGTDVSSRGTADAATNGGDTAGQAEEQALAEEDAASGSDAGTR